MAQLKNLLVSGTSRTIGKGYFGGLVSSTANEFIHNSNEFNFIPVGYNNSIYINYLDSNRGNATVTNYLFCTGQGSAGAGKATVTAGTFVGNLTGNASTATKATQDASGNVITSKYVAVDTTQTISGEKTFSNATTIINNKLQLTRASGVGHGRISFYNSSYYTWFEYMSNVVASGCPTGGTPSSYGDVTAWARRSLIENSATYGWIWEAATNSAASGTTAPTPLMALGSNTGNLKVKGHISTEVGFANSSSQVILKPGTGKYAVVLNNSVGDVDDGSANVASGAWSLATGTGTQATGWASFSGGSGYKTIASGNSSFAFGTGYNFLGTAASASGAVTFGGNSSGQYSFSVSGTAAHNHSFALGEGTKTYCANGFAVGKYNADNGALFAVGYGTSDSARTNVFDVSSTGDVMATGVIYAYNALGSDTGDLYLNNSSVNYNTTDECIEFKFY